MFELDKLPLFIYTRVSHGERKEDQDPETQVVLLEEYWRKQGYLKFIRVGLQGLPEVLEMNTAYVFAEHESARDLSAAERPIFLSMFPRLSEIAGIAVRKGDRFCRNSYDFQMYLNKIIKAGKFLFYLEDELYLNKDTPDDKMAMAEISATFNALLSKRISKATRDKYDVLNKAALKNNTKVRWGRIPLLTKDKRTIDPQQVKELLKAGYSYRDIARRLQCSIGLVHKIAKGE